MSEPEAKESRSATRPAAVRLEKGSLVEYDGSDWAIEKVVDFRSVVATHLEERHTQLLPIQDLNPAPTGHKGTGRLRRTPDYLSDEDWGVAEERYGAIEPLLKDSRRTREDVETRARETGVNPATLYRWIQRISAVNCLTALIPRKRGWTKGKTRIPAHAEEVITEVIETFYLKKRRRSIEKTVLEVKDPVPGQAHQGPSPVDDPGSDRADSRTRTAPATGVRRQGASQIRAEARTLSRRGLSARVRADRPHAGGRHPGRPQWTGQIRPFVDTANPAISGAPRRELISTSGRRSSARLSGPWCASFGVRT